MAIVRQIADFTIHSTAAKLKQKTSAIQKSRRYRRSHKFSNCVGFLVRK